MPEPIPIPFVHLRDERFPLPPPVPADAREEDIRAVTRCSSSRDPLIGPLSEPDEFARRVGVHKVAVREEPEVHEGDRLPHPGRATLAPVPDGLISVPGNKVPPP